MELKQLQYVIALAETSSFTKAAKRCFTAQSALSQQIARLEDELGTRLFDRTTRNVRITEEGHVVLMRARQIVDDVARIRSEIESLDGLHRGRLRVGATQTAARIVDLVHFFGSFHTAHPGIHLLSCCGPGHELVQKISDAQLDIALAARTLEPCPTNVVFRQLGPEEPLVAVTSARHPLAHREQTSLAELAASGPFIEFRAGTELRKRVEEAFRIAQVRRTITAELGQIKDMIRFVAHGEGAAIVPRAFTRPLGGEPAPGVRTLRLMNQDLAITMGAYLRRIDHSAAASAFLKQITTQRTDM
jgi:DNA-binding transcriptional LysR family regulator